jgi:hypothetical protein
MDSKDKNGATEKLRFLYLQEQFLGRRVPQAKLRSTAKLTSKISSSGIQMRKTREAI